MKNKPIMKCGHSANATDSNGNPVCVICIGIVPGATIVAEYPDLTGRFAVCENCGKNKRPSDFNLPFFEYKGPDSRRATETCKHCSITRTAHPSQGGSPYYKGTTTISPYLCENRGLLFEEIGPDDFDSYYCGCMGWD